MAKAKREIGEILRFVDVAIIIGDARLPLSSINPEVYDILRNKPFIIALNKSDLVPEQTLQKWEDYYAWKNIYAVPICSNNGDGFEELKKDIDKKARPIKEIEEAKGIAHRAVRILVVGSPNTGKSAFINKFAGRATMEVGNKAGVTKKQQWIKVRANNQNYDLLDTPGILPPKFETESQGEKLAWISAIKDDILDIIEISVNLCGFLYKIEDADEKYNKFLDIGREKGYLIKGGEVDEQRTAKSILGDFRRGKLGKFILE